MDSYAGQLRFDTEDHLDQVNGYFITGYVSEPCLARRLSIILIRSTQLSSRFS
jgi:hypothetical protein